MKTRKILGSAGYSGCQSEVGVSAYTSQHLKAMAPSPLF